MPSLSEQVAADAGPIGRRLWHEQRDGRYEGGNTTVTFGFHNKIWLGLLRPIHNQEYRSSP